MIDPENQSNELRKWYKFNTIKTKDKLIGCKPNGECGFKINMIYVKFK